MNTRRSSFPFHSTCPPLTAAVLLAGCATTDSTYSSLPPAPQHAGERAPLDRNTVMIPGVALPADGASHLPPDQYADVLDRIRAGQGLAPLPFGMALHVGEMLWGNIGTADRLDFTAIGPPVNLVSRLEGLCRPLGRSVLISGAVAAEITEPLVPLGEHVLRGIAAPCAVFTLPET